MLFILLKIHDYTAERAGGEGDSEGGPPASARMKNNRYGMVYGMVYDIVCRSWYTVWYTL
jgi:hypothetical protein